MVIDVIDVLCLFNSFGFIEMRIWWELVVVKVNVLDMGSVLGL